MGQGSVTSWILSLGSAFLIGIMMILAEDGLKWAFASVGLVAFASIYLVFRSGRPTLAPLVLVFAMFFLDSPWGRAFYEYDTITQYPGFFLFSNMHKTLGISGLSISIFEAVSLLIAVGLYIQKYWKDKVASPTGKTATLVALMLPLAATFGVIQGLLRGNDIGLALTQTRALVTLPVWFFIGWSLSRTPQFAIAALGLMALALVLKCFQALLIFRFAYGGSLDGREYLVEHLTSDYILSAVTFIIAFAFAQCRTIYGRILVLAMIPPMMMVFLINQRRSAFVGLAFSLMLVLFAMPRGWFARHSLKLVTLITTGILYIGATWNVSGPLGFAAHSFKSIVVAKKESSRDYRIAENANLYSALSDNIFLGMGFGRRFPIVVKMDDISSIYENFNLIPHNTLIFLWAYIGPIGIAAFVAFIAINLALATRVIRSGTYDAIWFLGLCSFLMIIRWAVYVNSDIGLLEVRSLAIIGLVLGAVWRLAPQIKDAGGQPS